VTSTATGGTTRLQAAAFGVLLLATLGAFLLANQLKSQPPEIDVLRRGAYFSPNGDGRRDTATVVFALKFDGGAAIDVVDADGVRVRRLAEDKRLRRGRPASVTWDGRDDDGARAPDGQYRLRFILDEGRSLLAPKPMYVDTVPPDVSVTVADGARIVSPGTNVPFQVSGLGVATLPRFTVLRTDVSPPLEVRSLEGAIGRDSYTWDGRTDSGAAAGPGVYLIAATAYDKAQNEAVVPGRPLRAPVAGRPGVTIRRLAVQPPVRAVQAGSLFSVRVDARGRAFSWTLRRLGERRPVRRGIKAAGKTNLVLRAPRGPSAIFLVRAQSHGAETTVPVAVRARTRVGPLVVLPMITWLGRDPIDGNGDGVPDVFGRAAAARFPRLFAYREGTPPGLYSEIAPLLLAMDAAKLRYDLATDLDLDFGDQPTADDRGVIMAGRPTWVSTAVARRLRRWVEEGGRLALFGPDALRASVSVGDSVLARPSPVTVVDALGGRLAEVRPLASDLTVLAEDPDLRLLEGFSGILRGFDAVEELVSAGRGKVTTSVGEETDDLRPAFSATVQGDGLVIRVGLPGWGVRLKSGDQAVGQLTANIVDVLRHVRPRPRTARG
jgi:flagellar hook assembly protein FlgD